MYSNFPRLLTVLLLAGTAPLMVSSPWMTTETQAQPIEIGTCANTCNKPYLRFRPGQRIKVQVTNRTYKTLQVENALGSQPLNIPPRSTIQFYRGGSTDPNLSIVFWDQTETPLRAVPSQPSQDSLKIEINFSPRGTQGDRSVYLDNDGQVTVL
jgi:hypothetical protein